MRIYLSKSRKKYMSEWQYILLLITRKAYVIFHNLCDVKLLNCEWKLFTNWYPSISVWFFWSAKSFWFNFNFKFAFTFRGIIMTEINSLVYSRKDEAIFLLPTKCTLHFVLTRWAKLPPIRSVYLPVIKRPQRRPCELRSQCGANFRQLF